MRSNLLNKRFNWLNLCQSDHFSSDLKESRNLQLLAACEFLYKCPTKPDALIQVESTNEIANIKNDLIKESVITNNKKGDNKCFEHKIAMNDDNKWKKQRNRKLKIKKNFQNN